MGGELVRRFNFLLLLRECGIRSRTRPGRKIVPRLTGVCRSLALSPFVRGASLDLQRHSVGRGTCSPLDSRNPDPAILSDRAESDELEQSILIITVEKEGRLPPLRWRGGEIRKMARNEKAEALEKSRRSFRAEVVNALLQMSRGRWRERFPRCDLPRVYVETQSCAMHAQRSQQQPLLQFGQCDSYPANNGGLPAIKDRGNRVLRTTRTAFCLIRKDIRFWLEIIIRLLIPVVFPPLSRTNLHWRVVCESCVHSRHWRQQFSFSQCDNLKAATLNSMSNERRRGVAAAKSFLEFFKNACAGSKYRRMSGRSGYATYAGGIINKTD